MSKLFDNSGKNTENEIYDTSHRQYWIPPGTVAWKDNLPFFLGIILCIILVALFDCFVLHPIPAPEGTFDPQQTSTAPFVLADSGCEYAGATVLYSDATSPGQEIYLVEQDGEVHLILFQQSILFTRKIADDLLITGDLPQTVQLRSGVGTWTLTIDEHMRLRDIYSFGAGNANQLSRALYAVIGIAIALTGSLIWHKIKKIKNNA